MNLSLDLHGVIDHNPEAFKYIAEKVLNDNGLVIIISGAIMDDLLEALDIYDIPFSRAYSVTDFLAHKHPDDYIINSAGRPMFPIDMWNSAKGDIIKQLAGEMIVIDMHIDDSPEYGANFPKETKFILYKE